MVSLQSQATPGAPAPSYATYYLINKLAISFSEREGKWHTIFGAYWPVTDIEDGVFCALTNKYAPNNKDSENQDIPVIFMTPQS